MSLLSCAGSFAHRSHHEPGDLVEVGARQTGKVDVSVTEKAIFFGELKGYAASKGYNDGWCAHKYREKYDVWPNLPRIKFPALRAECSRHRCRIAQEGLDQPVASPGQAIGFALEMRTRCAKEQEGGMSAARLPVPPSPGTSAHGRLVSRWTAVGATSSAVRSSLADHVDPPTTFH